MYALLYVLLLYVYITIGWWLYITTATIELIKQII